MSTDALESGTCATIWPLWNADPADLSLQTFEEAFAKAGELQLDDILLTAHETAQFHESIVYTICDIIITHGGDKLAHFRKELEKRHPQLNNKINPHVTPLHPMTAFPIDESTIVGNGEVAEAIYREAGVFDTPQFNPQVKILGGDQLSVARLRSLNNIRLGQEGGFASFNWGAWIPGLFHAKMADCHGNLITHFGQPNIGAQNPSSLWFHNTILQRIPIVLTSLPPFCKCRDLCFLSLYSRVLHCLLLVSGQKTLDDYSSQIKSLDQIWKHAEDICNKYANTNVVERLRQERQLDSGTRRGDMVFENAVLFLRDALISRMFASAVKHGESGLVVLILKVWALSFRGNGRTKYAHEMLHLIHNLTRVWPPAIARIILDNWLLNPSGRADGFVEMDRIQEFFNFWIKVSIHRVFPEVSNNHS